MGETMNHAQAALKLAAMMATKLSAHPTMPRSEATQAALSGVTEKAIELIQETDALRASLTEKDREIKRLMGELDTSQRRDFYEALSSSAVRTYGHLEPREALEAYTKDSLSAAQARERELEAQGVIDRDEQGRLREEIRVLTESKKFATDEACRFSSLYFESQAREREAVEELQAVLSDWNELVSAIGARANGTAIGHAKQIVSALAAARKALEGLLGQFTQPCHPGEPAMSAMVPVRELNRYRAALNGDSHE